MYSEQTAIERGSKGSTLREAFLIELQDSLALDNPYHDQVLSRTVHMLHITRAHISYDPGAIDGRGVQTKLALIEYLSRLRHFEASQIVHVSHAVHSFALSVCLLPSV